LKWTLVYREWSGVWSYDSCLFVYSYQYPGKILVIVCLYLIVFVCRVYDRMTVVCLYIVNLPNDKNKWNVFLSPNFIVITNFLTQIRDTCGRYPNLIANEDRMTVVCLYILTNILIKYLLSFVCLCRVYDRMTVFVRLSYLILFLITTHHRITKMRCSLYDHTPDIQKLSDTNKQ
jgi:hypothetical protein